jgi:hypothetical protein
LTDGRQWRTAAVKPHRKRVGPGLTMRRFESSRSPTIKPDMKALE